MDCATCNHPQRKEIERQSRAGVPATILEAWTRTTEGGYVSRLALGNHLRKHVGLTSKAGRRPMSGDLARDVVTRTSDRLEAGDIEPGIRDGLSAQALLDRRAESITNTELMLRFAVTLGGKRDPLRLPDPEVEAIEAEFVQLGVLEPEPARLPATLSEAD